MGPSVLNANTSTTLALSVLAFARNYTFLTLFKTWMVFLIGGLCNSILLLPVLLSFVGTTIEPESKLPFVVKICTCKIKGRAQEATKAADDCSCSKIDDT